MKRKIILTLILTLTLLPAAAFAELEVAKDGDVPLLIKSHTTGLTHIDFQGSDGIRGKISADSTKSMIFNVNGANRLYIEPDGDLRVLDDLKAMSDIRLTGNLYKTDIGVNFFADPCIEGQLVAGINSDGSYICRDDTSGTGGESLWSLAAGGSDIYYNAGKVGIGTNAPEAKLDLLYDFDPTGSDAFKISKVDVGEIMKVDYSGLVKIWNGNGDINGAKYEPGNLYVQDVLEVDNKICLQDDCRTSWPDTAPLGDNLGNHIAEQALIMNDNPILYNNNGNSGNYSIRMIKDPQTDVIHFGIGQFGGTTAYGTPPSEPYYEAHDRSSLHVVADKMFLSDSSPELVFDSFHPDSPDDFVINTYPSKFSISEITGGYPSGTTNKIMTLLWSNNTSMPRVGIGTDAPNAQLDVNGDVWMEGFRLRNDAAIYTPGQVLVSDDQGRGTWQDMPAAPGDNLGNHIATQNIQTQDHWISGDGADEGIFVDNAGRVNINVSRNDPERDDAELVIDNKNGGGHIQSAGPILYIDSTVGGIIKLAYRHPGHISLANDSAGRVCVGCHTADSRSKLEIQDDAVFIWRGVQNGSPSNAINYALNAGDLYVENFLEVDNKIISAGLQMPTDAADGKVLISDADGNATWQDPVFAEIHATNLVYSDANVVAHDDIKSEDDVWVGKALKLNTGGGSVDVNDPSTCNDDSRGEVWFIRSPSAGVGDGMYICRKNPSGAYEWKTLLDPNE